MNVQDFAALRAHAEAGDREAMAAYGKLLLSGDGAALDVLGGSDFVARAAALDSGEALAQLAVLVGAGIANAASWHGAFSHLQRAAELGWAPAQEQLRFLSGRGGDDFAALRDHIDIVAWQKPPPTKLVSEAPRILTAEALMSPAECARMIAKARHKLKRASIYDTETGLEAKADERDNSSAQLSLTEVDLPFLLLHARMAALLGLPSRNFEPTAVLHYLPGQRFKPHFDFLDVEVPGFAANVKDFGQRVVTLLVYLNEDYDGGETDFPRLNYHFKGRTGDALMFGNVTAKGAPDPLTLHAGLPTLRGEKWLLSQWVRNRAAVGQSALPPAARDLI